MESGQIKVTEKSDLLEAFIRHTPFGIIVIDMSGKIKIANALASDYLSLKSYEQNLADSNIIGIIEHIPELFETLKNCLDKVKGPFQIESLFIDDKYLSISGQLIFDGYIITIEDISKQKEIEANSILAILEGQENERRRIGREIHDGIGPLLSFMKLSLESFTEELGRDNLNANTEILDNISETIDSITLDLRTLSHRLVPRLLDEFGLNPAFENMIYKLNESKRVNIRFYTNIEKDIRLDRDIELNIFRCGQELLHNAVKYAKAKSILVQVILHKVSIVLMVEDDGVGFEKDKHLLENFGIGLTNIDTRVRMLNGEFNIESSLGKGTVASIEIPFPTSLNN